ncbi:MAG TPA: hypothetical protein VK932_01250 [Kofleriaceae bacterium]|nr:hypothetical protein [Kofleriaceae bacterium]
MIYRVSGSQDDAGGVDPRADLELRAIRVAQSFQADRGVPVPVCRRDRLLLAEGAVEADREGPRHVIVERATHPDNAVDMREQRLRRCLPMARAQDDQPDRATGGPERLRDGCGRDDPSVSIRRLEEHPVPTPVAAEVNHRRLERA